MLRVARVVLPLSLLAPLAIAAGCSSEPSAPAAAPPETPVSTSAALAGPPAVGASTTWVATGVVTDATAFTLVDLGGTVYSFGRGTNGLLQAGPDVASAASVPGSPAIVGDGVSAVYDAATRKVFVVVRTPAVISRVLRAGIPSHVMLAEGTVANGAVTQWTWTQLGNTDAPPAIAIGCNQIKVAARYAGTTYTESRATGGGAFSGWVALAQSTAGRPVLGTNGLGTVGLALVGNDHLVHFWMSACNATFDSGLTIGDGTVTTSDDHVSITALGALFGVGMRDRDGYPRYLQQRWGFGPWWTGGFEDVDGQPGGPKGLSIAQPIEEPPVVTTFRGLTFMAARGTDDQMYYWVRSQNAIDLSSTPSWRAWVGGRVVSGYGTGATPPAFVATGTVNRSSVGYGQQVGAAAELYVATRGGGDKQLYALNMGRFATLDVLEGVYNQRVDTGYWEKGTPKNTVPNLFEYLIGWMATPSTLWAPLAGATACAYATDGRGSSIFPTQSGGEGVEGCYVAANGFPSPGGITVDGKDGSAMRVWEEWGHEFLWKQFDMTLFGDTQARACRSNADCGTTTPTGAAACLPASTVGFGYLSGTFKGGGNGTVCAMPDKYTGGRRPQGFANDYSTTTDYHNLIYVMLMYRWFGAELRAMASADAAYGDSRLQAKYNFVRDRIYLGHEYLGTRDAANTLGTGDETSGAFLMPLQ